MWSNHDKNSRHVINIEAYNYKRLRVCLYNNNYNKTKSLFIIPITYYVLNQFKTGNG